MSIGKNYHVQEESGAVIFHKSPELLEIMDIKKQIDELNTKLDKILTIMEGGTVSGEKMARQGQRQNDDEQVQRSG